MAKRKQKQSLGKKQWLTMSAIGLAVALFPLLMGMQVHGVEVVRFVENKPKGLVWTGLKENLSGQCGGDLESYDDQGTFQGCVHGPDPAAEHVDVREPAVPLGQRSIEQLAAADPPIQCDGDGVTGARIELIYAVSTDRPNRFDQFAASFPVYAQNMNTVFYQSGLEGGSVRNIRFVTNPDCSLIVRNESLSPTGDDSIGNTRSELRAKGYTRSDRKYIVFADASVYCGISYVQNDSRPGQDNISNTAGGFGRVDSGCWGGSASVAAHELMHELGGVQKDAPNSNGAFHCTDEYDRMCYDDGSGATLQYICATAEETKFDCNKDDYFNSGSVAAGTYLSSHWNTANSRFLIAGSTGSTTTTVEPATAPAPTPLPPAPPDPPAPPPVTTRPTPKTQASKPAATAPVPKPAPAPVPAPTPAPAPAPTPLPAPAPAPTAVVAPKVTFSDTHPAAAAPEPTLAQSISAQLAALNQPGQQSALAGFVIMAMGGGVAYILRKPKKLKKAFKLKK